MEMELEASPESEPLLMFTPGNVTLLPVIDIQAFALLPNSSDRKPLFQIRVVSLVLTREQRGMGAMGGRPSLD
jgi:lipopolysaccharide-binding protein